MKYSWLRGLVPKGNREAAAQNFVFQPCKNDLFSYLFGTKNDVLIKVYPSHKTLLTGFEDRETIDIPNLQTSHHWGVMALFWLARLFDVNDSADTNKFYQRLSTEVLDGDELSIFGLLRYDEVNGFYFDKPIAFMNQNITAGLQTLQQHLSFAKVKSYLSAA